MTSHFELEKDTIIERLGSLKLHFRVIEEDGGLYYQFVRACLWSISLPKALSPVVHARERETDGKYDFLVEVKMPMVGDTISYGGVLSVKDS